VWLGKGGGRANPSDAAWRTQAFVFYDESGAQVSITGGDVPDTATQLGCTYEDVTKAAVLAERAAEAVSEPPERGGEPEFVGASERPVELVGEPTSVEVVIDRRAVEARAREAAEATPARVYLNLEDIEAERNPAVVYEVFVGIRGADVAPRYVGNVSFFGIEHLATEQAGEGPHGLRRTFDITEPVEQLRAQGRWDDQQVVVSLRPVSPIPPPGGELSSDEAAELTEAQTTPVRIGRVSLFYA
jgi:hypothetical protein